MAVAHMKQLRGAMAGGMDNNYKPSFLTDQVPLLKRYFIPPQKKKKANCPCSHCTNGAVVT